MSRTPEQIAYFRLQSRLTKRMNKACADYGLIQDGDHILVGLSGGKDSLLLTELLGKRAQIYVPRFSVTAVHVRVEGRAYQSDLAYLEDFCRAVQVPFVVRDTAIRAIPHDTPTHQEKDPCFLCAWYRRKALFDTAQQLGCNKIALGHHKDDIIETLLLNLVYQGSFGTIAPRLQMDKMPLQLIRPLCLMEERDIAQYAQLSHYQRQKQLCPFEKATRRADIKHFVNQLSALNPHVLDSMWGAMENIKTDYLPHKLT